MPTIENIPGLAATPEKILRYDVLASDADGDSLTYDLPLNPVGMTVDSDKGTIVWQPTEEQIGVSDAVLRIRDGRGGLALQPFEVDVTFNSSPTVVGGSDRIAPLTVGLPFEYRINTQDADGDRLTFQLETAPEGMSIDKETGVLSWTPTIDQLGEQLVTAIVSDDGGAETTETLSLEVLENAPNSPPTITSTPRQRVRIGDNYLYSIDATDPNNDPLTYTLETAPKGMTVSSDGRIFWQPTAADAGVNAVGIAVSDGRGGEVLQEFDLAVTSTGSNRPPSISSTPKLAATVAQQYQYNLTGSDPDGDEF